MRRAITAMRVVRIGLGLASLALAFSAARHYRRAEAMQRHADEITAGRAPEIRTRGSRRVALSRPALPLADEPSPSWRRRVEEYTADLSVLRDSQRSHVEAAGAAMQLPASTIETLQRWYGIYVDHALAELAGVHSAEEFTAADARIAAMNQAEGWAEARLLGPDAWRRLQQEENKLMQGDDALSETWMPAPGPAAADYAGLFR